MLDIGCGEFGGARRGRYIGPAMGAGGALGVGRARGGFMRNLFGPWPTVFFSLKLALSLGWLYPHPQTPAVETWAVIALPVLYRGVVHVVNDLNIHI